MLNSKSKLFMLLMVLVLALSACGGAATPAEEAPAPEAAEEAPAAEEAAEEAPA